MKTRELHREGSNFDSIYICPGTFACAQLATGAACRLVEAVLAGEVPPPWGWGDALGKLGGGVWISRRVGLGQRGLGRRTPAPGRPCLLASVVQEWGLGAPSSGGGVGSGRDGRRE